MRHFIDRPASCSVFKFLPFCFWCDMVANLISLFEWIWECTVEFQAMYFFWLKGMSTVMYRVCGSFFVCPHMNDIDDNLCDHVLCTVCFFYQSESCNRQPNRSSCWLVPTWLNRRSTSWRWPNTSKQLRPSEHEVGISLFFFLTKPGLN